MLIFINKLHLQ